MAFDEAAAGKLVCKMVMLLQRREEAEPPLVTGVVKCNQRLFLLLSSLYSKHLDGDEDLP